MYVCMHVCKYVMLCMHVCVCVCMYVCMQVCVCVYICMCVCVYVFMYVCMYSHKPEIFDIFTNKVWPSKIFYSCDQKQSTLCHRVFLYEEVNFRCIYVSKKVNVIQNAQKDHDQEEEKGFLW